MINSLKRIKVIKRIIPLLLYNLDAFKLITFPLAIADFYGLKCSYNREKPRKLLKSTATAPRIYLHTQLSSSGK